VPDTRLNHAAPEADLVQYISHFYLFEADGPAFEGIERADRAQLRFRLNAISAEYRFPDGSVQEARGVHVVGPTTGAVKVRANGPVRTFGAGITPHGWSALIGAGASTMVNRVFHADELFAGAFDGTIERLAVETDVDAMAGIAGKVIGGLINHEHCGSHDFVRAVDAWLIGSGSPSLGDLARQTRLSRRQVERKCNALYGAPPKMLARKYRALRAAVALGSGTASLDDVIDRGFYDQSHLIREIKHFTGLTPRQISNDPPLLARLSLGRDEASGDPLDPLTGDVRLTG